MIKNKFPSETLMEIAGLAVAQVANKIIKSEANCKICVLVGPGNNGGDGLVAARHMKMMKYDVEVLLFKKQEGKNGIYHELCSLNGIPHKTPENFEEPISTSFPKYLTSFNLIIDAVFGFPFCG